MKLTKTATLFVFLLFCSQRASKQDISCLVPVCASIFTYHVHLSKKNSEVITLAQLFQSRVNVIWVELMISQATINNVVTYVASLQNDIIFNLVTDLDIM